MGSEFELFTERSFSVDKKKPRLAIQKGGAISLNRAAFEQLGEPGFVVLLYNRERRAIALRRSTSDVPYRYPVRKQKESPSYLVSGKAFLSHSGIRYGHRVIRLYPTMEQGMLVAELPDEEEEVTNEGTKGA